jgi:hypothetical protein
MRRLIVPVIGLAVVLALSIPSFAQEVNYPKAEIFGGFSILSMSGTSIDPTTGLPAVDPTTGLPISARNSMWGWQASANGNLSHHLAIVGDFGAQYKTLGGLVPVNSYQFLFGPRMVFRGPRFTPFVHFLFGGIKEGTGSFSITDPVSGLSVSIPGASSTGFGMGIGGGIDVNISDRFALRVPQFDWTPVRVSSTSLDPVTGLPVVSSAWAKSQIRIGIGLVLKAGQK